jgi:hypothetical protein
MGERGFGQLEPVDVKRLRQLEQVFEALNETLPK